LRLLSSNGDGFHSLNRSLRAQLSFPLARIDPFLTDRLTSPQGRQAVAEMGWPKKSSNAEKSNVELWNPKNPRRNMVCHDVSCWKPMETAFIVDLPSGNLT
jgi:hypothetical protein